MQHRAPPAVAMRIDQVRNGCIDAGLRQCRDHKIAFPGPVWRVRPMLGGAAAANAEMRTKGSDAIRRGRLHAQKIAPVGMARHGFGVHRFVRQGVGNKDIPVRRDGDAVGAMTHMCNDKPFAHRTLPWVFYGEPGRAWNVSAWGAPLKEDCMARRYSRSASKDVERAMKKRKRGTLKSGGSGRKVRSRKQAIAIGLSEARAKGKKVPKRRRA